MSTPSSNPFQSPETAADGLHDGSGEPPLGLFALGLLLAGGVVLGCLVGGASGAVSASLLGGVRVALVDPAAANHGPEPHEMLLIAASLGGFFGVFLGGVAGTLVALMVGGRLIAAGRARTRLAMVGAGTAGLLLGALGGRVLSFDALALIPLIVAGAALGGVGGAVGGRLLERSVAWLAARLARGGTATA